MARFRKRHKKPSKTTSSIRTKLTKIKHELKLLSDAVEQRTPIYPYDRTTSLRRKGINKHKKSKFTKRHRR